VSTVRDTPADRRGRDWRGHDRRGQANLVALVAALFALTTAMVVGIAVADSALAGSSGHPDRRHAATAVAAGIVSDESPLTNRTNVLDSGAVEDLTAQRLRARYPVLDERAFRVTVGDETVANAGTVTDGATMRRIVLVERTRTLAMEPEFDSGNVARLPQRAPSVTVDISTPKNRSVSTVRADGRTVLHDPDGQLDGTYTVDLSRRSTARLTFVANGTLEQGDVELALHTRDTEKAVLGVTVDA
jgi:hypothetical protein